jgi:hypothetical protein
MIISFCNNQKLASQILKNKFRFIPIHFLILFIIGCGDKPKEIVFQDTNNTPNVKITLQSPSGKILETANSNSQGAVKFVGVFEEGTKLKYKIEARLKKPIMEWHRSSWWPNKYEIIIGENKSYEIFYYLEDAGKTVKFVSDRKIPGIKISGLNGSINKFLGVTDQGGKFSYELDKKEWPSITFIGEHEDGDVNSNELNQRYFYDYLPKAPIKLAVRPSRDCYFPIKLTETGTTKPIINASIYHKETKQTWQTNSIGLVIPVLTTDMLNNLDIQINDRISFAVNSFDFEKKSQSFVINSQKYKKDSNSKQINLKRVYKLNIFVKDMEGYKIEAVKATVGGIQIGKTDENGLIIYEYEISDVGKNIKMRASKTNYIASERNISLSAESGKIFNITTKKIIPVEIIVQDEEDGSSLNGKTIYINSLKYVSDKYGVVKFYPKDEIVNLKYKYSGKDKFHYPKEGAFKATPSERVFYLQLRPKTVLILRCYADLGGGQTDPLLEAEIRLNGNKIGETDENGTFKYPLIASLAASSFTIKVERRGFEPDTKEISTSSSKHIEEFYLRGIIGQVIVEDVYKSGIEGVEVKVSGQSFMTNRTGRATILLDKLNIPLQLEFFDPDNRFETNKKTFTFVINKDRKKVTLIRKPITLEVTVMWTSGSPAIGRIRVSPPPDPQKAGSGYKLKAGTAKVKIFEPRTYTVSYETNPPIVVTGSMDVTIDMEKDKAKSLKFPPIPDASFSVMIDEGTDIPVDVFLADKYKPGSSSGRVGKLRGDGQEKFDLSDYGYGTDLVLVYRRAGWTKDKEERVKSMEPDQVFIFSVGANLDKCKQFEKSGQYKDACDECEKIPISSSDYCESRKTMIEIYDNQLNQSENSLKALLDYLENSSCGENFRYNLKLFSLASRSQMSKVPKELRDPIVLKRYFDETINLITVQVAGNNKTIYAKKLSSFACDYGIQLMKYYSMESKKFKNRSDDFHYYMDDLRFAIQNKWIKNLSSSERIDISGRMAGIN